MPEFLGSRFNWQVGQFDHLSKKKKKNLSKKMYLMGALDSAQYFIA
jgi:hypothetical protein